MSGSSSAASEFLSDLPTEQLTEAQLGFVLAVRGLPVGSGDDLVEVCARVAAADSPLATRPQPTPPHPPQPRFCPTGRRVRAVRVPPVALWLARSGRAVWWALCPRLSLPPARGRVRFSPPPPVLVCLRARAGGRSSLRGAVGAVAAFYLFLASSYCGPLRLAPGRAPWRPPPCAT